MNEKDNMHDVRTVCDASYRNEIFYQKTTWINKIKYVLFQPEPENSTFVRFGG